VLEIQQGLIQRCPGQLHPGFGGLRLGSGDDDLLRRGLRTLRLRDLLFLFIGSVIGSGIFLSPGLILRQVHGSVGLAMLFTGVRHFKH